MEHVLAEKGYQQTFSQICKGDRGTILKCAKHGKRYVCKATKNKDGFDEAQILKSLDFPKVIQLLDSTKHAGREFCFFDYYKPGNIKDFLDSQNPNLISESTIRNVFLEIIEAIQYIHSYGIIHTNIEPRNILVSHFTVSGDLDIEIKLCGFSRAIREDNLFFIDVNDLNGKVSYYSPERCIGVLNFAGDLWSAGILLYNMVYRKFPYEGKDKEEIKTAIFEHEFEPKIKSDDGPWFPKGEFLINKSGQKLIGQLLTSDYEKRISAKNAENAEWFHEQSSIIDIQDLVCFNNGPKHAYLRSIFGEIASTFTNHGDLDLLVQMYEEHDKKFSFQKIHTLKVKTGYPGFFEDGNGYITDIDSGTKLHKLGVEVGWKITKVNGQPFTSNLFELAMDGSMRYKLTFEFPTDHITSLCFHSILENELQQKINYPHVDYLFATIAGKSKRISCAQFLNECILCSFVQKPQNGKFDAFFKSIAGNDGNMYPANILEFLEGNMFQCDGKIFTKAFKNLFGDSTNIEKFKEILFTKITDPSNLVIEYDEPITIHIQTIQPSDELEDIYVEKEKKCCDSCVLL